jgi:hypothetical protein
MPFTVVVLLAATADCTSQKHRRHQFMLFHCSASVRMFVLVFPLFTERTNQRSTLARCPIRRTLHAQVSSHKRTVDILLVHMQLQYKSALALASASAQEQKLEAQHRDGDERRTEMTLPFKLPLELEGHRQPARDSEVTPALLIPRALPVAAPTPDAVTITGMNFLKQLHHDEVILVSRFEFRCQ